MIPIGIMGTMKIPKIKVLIEMRTASVFLLNVKIAKRKHIVQPIVLILIIILKFLRLWIMAPDENDDIRPKRTVVPLKSDVYPVPRTVAPKIVPMTEPNPIKLPSIQKNASSIKL